jgi:hypothetical protein
MQARNMLGKALNVPVLRQAKILLEKLENYLYFTIFYTRKELL